jgi:uncharacterized DUF497 family protein
MYEWDEDKNQKNLTKHGFSFKDADSVFAGSCVTYRNRRLDYGEERFITLGLLEGRVMVVAQRRENTHYINEKG